MMKISSSSSLSYHWLIIIIIMICIHYDYLYHNKNSKSDYHDSSCSIVIYAFMIQQQHHHHYRYATRILKMKQQQQQQQQQHHISFSFCRSYWIKNNNNNNIYNNNIIHPLGGSSNDNDNDNDDTDNDNDNYEKSIIKNDNDTIIYYDDFADFVNHDFISSSSIQPNANNYYNEDIHIVLEYTINDCNKIIPEMNDDIKEFIKSNDDDNNDDDDVIIKHDNIDIDFEVTASLNDDIITNKSLLSYDKNSMITNKEFDNDDDDNEEFDTNIINKNEENGNDDDMKNKKQLEYEEIFISDTNNLVEEQSSSSSLINRIHMIQQKELYIQKSIQRNWDLGNWQVRGFQIIDDNDNDDINDDINDDDNDNQEDDESKMLFTTSTNTHSRNQQKQQKQQERNVHINSIIPYVPNILLRITEVDDDSDNDDYDDDINDHDNDMIWVSRTDGSVFCIQLGTDYMTKIKQNQINNKKSSTSEEMNNDNGIISKPFRIRAQFQTNPTISATRYPVTAMAVIKMIHDDDDDDDDEEDDMKFTTNNRHHWLYTATKHHENGYGVIRRWNIITTTNDDDDEDDDDDDDDDKIIVIPDNDTILMYMNNDNDNTPVHTFESPFAIRVMSFILTINDNDNTMDNVDSNSNRIRYNILVSIDSRYISLWDIISNQFMCRYDIIDIMNHDQQQEEDIKILCIDTDHTKYIYLGISSGEVIALSIHDMILQQQKQSGLSNIQPCGRWLASSNSKSITSITCGGIGTMGNKSQQQQDNIPSTKRNHNSVATASKTTTMILYTGTLDGIIKKWEIFERDNNNHVVLEYWPKLSTQRMYQSAHIFQTKSFENDDTSVTAITALSSSTVSNNNNNIMISSYSDNTIRIWDTCTGKELYTMDLGNDNNIHQSMISSLCLLHNNNILISNGMDPYVCIHDFSIENPEDDDNADYELDMPEYNNNDRR